MIIDDVPKQGRVPAAHMIGNAGQSTQAGVSPSQNSDVKQAQSPSVDRKAIEQAVTKIQESIGQVDSSLRIEVDSDIHQVIVKVVNNQSGEVIRQIPSQEIVEISKRLDAMQGLLLTKRT